VVTKQAQPVLTTTGFRDVMQQRVYLSLVRRIDEVNQRLLNLCHLMDHSTNDNAIDEWHVFGQTAYTLAGIELLNSC